MDKFLVVFSFLVGLWLLCRTVLEPVAVVTRFQNMAVMRDAVQQRRGHLGISEHIGPLTEAQVGGYHDARALVQLGTAGGTAKLLLTYGTAGSLRD